MLSRSYKAERVQFNVTIASWETNHDRIMRLLVTAFMVAMAVVSAALYNVLANRYGGVRLFASEAANEPHRRNRASSDRNDSTACGTRETGASPKRKRPSAVA